MLGSEKVHKFFNGEARLADDRSKRAGFEIAIPVYRNCDRSSQIAWYLEHMMASRDAIDNKSSLGERSNNILSACDRQTARTH